MPRYRVLIVDDHRDIRRVLSAGLASLEIKVEVVDVPSGEEAMLVATHGAFDLMVSDVHLPGMSGLDLVRWVQRFNPTMKVILITGVTEPAIRREVENAGAEAFFFKPIELDDFLGQVERSLGTLVVVDEDSRSEQEPQHREERLTVVDRLENLRRKAVMGMAAVLNTGGEVIAQAGFLTGVYDRPGLAKSLGNLYASGLTVSQVLKSDEPENLFYLAGADQYFHILSINSEHLLVLTSEQPFHDQIEALNEWLPDEVRVLDQMLGGRAPASQQHADEAVDLETLVGQEELPPPEEDPLFRSLEEELADVEVSAEDQAAIDALFGDVKLEETDLDGFWEDVVEESGSLHKTEGSISFEEAQNLGLAPGEDESA
jgi:CheY-like chemotaxis protein